MKHLKIFLIAAIASIQQETASAQDSLVSYRDFVIAGLNSGQQPIEFTGYPMDTVSNCENCFIPNSPGTKIRVNYPYVYIGDTVQYEMTAFRSYSVDRYTDGYGFELAPNTRGAKFFMLAIIPGNKLVSMNIVFEGGLQIFAYAAEKAPIRFISRKELLDAVGKR